MKKDKFWWIKKLVELVEKENALYDKRGKKFKKIHPTGECYMNEIIALFQKVSKK